MKKYFIVMCKIFIHFGTKSSSLANDCLDALSANVTPFFQWISANRLDIIDVFSIVHSEVKVQGHYFDISKQICFTFQPSGLHILPYMHAVSVVTLQRFIIFQLV